MKKTGKKLITLGLIVAMALTMLTGCTPGKNSTVLTVDGSSLSFSEVNFYARYTQSVTELYAQYYGTTADQMWAQYIGEDQTYEDSVKADIKEDLESMLILEQHMGEYGVEITAEDQEEITKVAEDFINKNDSKTLKVMTADQASVERILTALTVRSRVQAAIEDGADKEVSESEALRKKLMYVKFPYSMTVYESENSNSEKDEKLNEIIDGMTSADNGMVRSAAEAEAKEAYTKLKVAKDEDTFNTIAEEASLTASSANIGEGVTTPSALVVEKAMKMKVGKVSEPILDEDASAYYVVMLANDRDEDATEAAKTTIINNRKNDLFDEVYNGFREAASVKWNDRKFNKISFIKQGCVYEVAQAELSDDPGLTAEEGDKVAIDYVGTVDGVAFENGTGSDDNLVIGSGTMIPGFEDGIIGHHPGEVFTIDVTFPDNYDKADMAGKDAQFEITLKGIYKD